MMPAGRSICDNGVSTEAAADGTWLRIRNRRASQLVAPALTDSAGAAKSTTPRPASSPAARVFGTRAGRFGHHHDPGEIIGTEQSACRPSAPAPPVVAPSARELIADTKTMATSAGNVAAVGGQIHSLPW